MPVRVECVTDPARLAQVGADWQALWSRAGRDIFQHHHWIATWATHTAERRDLALRISLAWDGDRLIATLPCVVARVRGLRVLQWAGQDFSDYCDVLVDPDADAAVIDQLWEDTVGRGGIDLVQLRQIRPDARIRTVLARDGSGVRQQSRQEQCLHIDCQWPNGDAYFRSLNKKGRNNHTRGKRILEEIGGPFSFRNITMGSEARLVLARLLELKHAWLKTTDPGSPFLGRDIALFPTMLTAGLETEVGSIFALFAGETLVTGSINFTYESKMQAYFTAYDPAFERASPGTILIVEYSKWAFDRAIREVDFLRGDELFKFRLSNAQILLEDYLGARSLLGHAAKAAQDWRVRLRRPRGRTPPAEMPALSTT